MTKSEFKEYLELKRKQRELYETIEVLKRQLEEFDYQETIDIVTRGRKHKRVMGRTVVRGYNHKKYTDIKNKLLQKQLDAAQFECEEFSNMEFDAMYFVIGDIPRVENGIRFILLNLVPFPGEPIKTWTEIAQSMKKRHGMSVKPDALRMKVLRFLES